MSAPALHLDKVGRCYKQAGVALDVLRAVDFGLWPGNLWRWSRLRVPANPPCFTSRLA